jgi:hypothetical protein
LARRSRLGGRHVDSLNVRVALSLSRSMFFFDEAVLVGFNLSVNETGRSQACLPSRFGERAVLSSPAPLGKSAEAVWGKPRGSVRMPGSSVESPGSVLVYLARALKCWSLGWKFPDVAVSVEASVFNAVRIRDAEFPPFSGEVRRRAGRRLSSLNRQETSASQRSARPTAGSRFRARRPRF